MAIPPLHHRILHTGPDDHRLGTPDRHRNGQVVDHVKHSNGYDEGQIEPVCHIDVRLFAFDDRAEGFDAIFENPMFAGADTSFWIRQPVPLIGGGAVGLSGRNGVLNSLRSSKEQGQSNFINPGTMLVGLGIDADLTPETRLTLNANQIWFQDTAVLSAARNQGVIDKSIGTDLSLALTWRPYMIQNIVFRLSGAALIPGEGYESLLGQGERTAYSFLLNMVLSY